MEEAGVQARQLAWHRTEILHNLKVMDEGPAMVLHTAFWDLCVASTQVVTTYPYTKHLRLEFTRLTVAIIPCLQALCTSMRTLETPTLRGLGKS